jgi:sugar transferase (PEP-CTERM/EpsH1 system associated)
MRILYLAHRIPYPPNKGDKIRSFHEIQGLQRLGHDVDVLAFADDPRDMLHREALSRFCASVEVVRLQPWTARARSVLGVASQMPLSVHYYAASAMRRLVARRLAAEWPDRCVAYSSTMAQYVPDALRHRTVVDLIDVDSEKWADYARRHPAPMAAVYRLEAMRLRRYELFLVRRFRRSVVTTEQEADLLRGALDPRTRGRLHAIVNGVDLDAFSPHAAVAALRAGVPASEARHLAPGHGPVLVFTGAMDYFANVDAVRWFVAEVWPTVRGRHPEARFVIVGSRPAPAVRALAAAPGVVVTGFVNDTRPYLAAADLVVAPLRIARGVQNKVLEAMACGKATVATVEAAAGVGAAAGRELVVAGDALALAGAILQALADPSWRDRLGVAARAFVEREHRWSEFLGRFCDVLESAGDRRVAA